MIAFRCMELYGITFMEIDLVDDLYRAIGAPPIRVDFVPDIEGKALIELFHLNYGHRLRLREAVEDLMPFLAWSINLDDARIIRLTHMGTGTVWTSKNICADHGEGEDILNRVREEIEA